MKSMTFGGRMKMLRIERGYTQDEMRSLFGAKMHRAISSSGLSSYENDKRFPDKDMLSDLSDFYDVTIDYLMGRTDDRKASVPSDPGNSPDNIKYKQYSEVYDEFQRRLIEAGLLKEGEELSPTQLRKFLGLGLDTAKMILRSKDIDVSVLDK